MKLNWNITFYRILNLQPSNNKHLSVVDDKHWTVTIRTCNILCGTLNTDFNQIFHHKYTVSPKNVVSCFFFAILLASTHPNCKSWGNFEKFRKFAYFSKFLCLPCSKFPEIFKTILTFAIWISKIAKKISFIFWGHPVHTILLIFNVNDT